MILAKKLLIKVFQRNLDNLLGCWNFLEDLSWSSKPFSNRLVTTVISEETVSFTDITFTYRLSFQIAYLETMTFNR